MRVYIILFSIFMFLGCTQPLDVSRLSVEYQKEAQLVATYNPKEEELVFYEYHIDGNIADMKRSVTFVPKVTDDIYSPFTGFKYDILKIDAEASTVQQMLENSTRRSGLKKFIVDKEEFVIDYQVAREAYFIIQDINKYIQKIEKIEREGIDKIPPLF